MRFIWLDDLECFVLDHNQYKEDSIEYFVMVSRYRNDGINFWLETQATNTALENWNALVAFNLTRTQ